MFNKAEMFHNYHATTAAAAYIIGFALKGRAYMVTVAQLREAWVSMARESQKNGGALKLRMAVTNAVKCELLEMGAVDIGAAEDILSLRHNKGEAFEQWVTEYYGQTWVKDHIPYYMDGDITVDGIKYQIKWENASLTNENVIRKAMEWKLGR